MSYDYYCTYCGKRLRQDAQAKPNRVEEVEETIPVLFDMQYLFTGNDPKAKDSKRFSTLQMRLTEYELENLLNCAESRNEASGIHMSFTQAVQYLCNKNNLNSDVVKKLTLEDIRTYLKEDNLRYSSTQKPKKRPRRFGDSDETDEEENEPVNEQVEVKPVPAAIQELIRQAEINMGDEAVAVNIKEDLELFERCFAASSDNRGEIFRFELSRVEENSQDDDDAKVLTGYQFKRWDSQQNIYVGNARVCPKCGEPIIDHAGTAPHQAITFIGAQESGKTSTILAMASYLNSQWLLSMDGNTDVPEAKIWESATSVHKGSTFEPISRSAELKRDLDLYLQGIAPEKTKDENRKDAYSATFRIKNERDNKYTLLTLTDLPGEICDEQDGTVNEYKVKNAFQAGLTCNTFVACFDTSRISSNRYVCKWADKFQSLRLETDGLHQYVPTMLLFTKCRELEESPPTKEARTEKTPGKLVRYNLYKEQLELGRNSLHKNIINEFVRFGELNSGYRASVRSSPYGYRAPTLNYLRALFSTNEEENRQNARIKEETCAKYRKYNALAKEEWKKKLQESVSERSTELYERENIQNQIGKIHFPKTSGNANGESLDLHAVAEDSSNKEAVLIPYTEIPVGWGSRTALLMKGTYNPEQQDYIMIDLHNSADIGFYCVHKERRKIDGLSREKIDSAVEEYSRNKAVVMLFYASDEKAALGASTSYTLDIYEQLAPSPRNIDLLVNWLLSVTGCIPAEAKVDPFGGGGTVRYEYRLERPQLRSQPPIKGARVEEAAIRCALFENPGYLDQEYVKLEHGSKNKNRIAKCLLDYRVNKGKISNSEG